MKSHRLLLKEFLAENKISLKGLSPPMVELLTHEAWCRENGFVQVRKYLFGYLTVMQNIPGEKVFFYGVVCTLHEEIPDLPNVLCIDIGCSLKLSIDKAAQKELLPIIYLLN